MASATASDEENDRLVGERENNDLTSATSETSSIIVELSLETPIRVRWVSSSWQDIIGTDPSTLVGETIEQFIANDPKTLFSDATRQVLEDDSTSIRLRFWLALPTISGSEDVVLSNDNTLLDSTVPLLREAVELDANGILIHDRMSGEPTHTMWVFSIVQDLEDMTDGSLDPQLSKALLGGAEFLSTYLQQLLSVTCLPAPTPLTCNICDRQIQPWFFEKHTALCIVSHKAESEVQDCHDHLRDHRQVITEILAQLRKNTSTVLYAGHHLQCAEQLETQSRTTSPSLSSKAKLTKERRLQLRAVETMQDYCDLAIDISTPAIPEDDNSNLFSRIQSPDSRTRINQLQNWKPASLDEPALTALCEETQALIGAKISAVTRLHNTIHYSEKIRQEIDIRVQDLIDQAAEDGCASRDHVQQVEVALDVVPDVTGESTTRPSPATIQNRDYIANTPIFREPFQEQSRIQSCALSASHPASPIGSISAGLEAAIEQAPRASSPLSQHTPVIHTDLPTKPSSLLSSVKRPDSSTSSIGDESVDNSRRNSPQDLENQIREMRISRGIYESPRRPSGGSRPPTGFSPSRRGSRAVSRNRATNLARERTASPSRKALNARLNFIERDRLSPTASPTLSATDSNSTDASHRDRRVSTAPPLSPRLPSIAPAARPAPPSIKDFDIIKPISKGAFGSVYLSKKRTTGDYYAIKVLKKADMIAKNQVTNIKAERAIMMAQTESPFIAKLFFTFQSKEYLYLVMEYLNGGDCAALIKQLGGLPEDWTRRYMAEVVLGLEYLHSRGIIHRDLKPDNLLISHNGHLKLTDFGLSRVGLVGRQNRARTASHADAPDLLHSLRASSPSSSRSASFDFQSGLSTPAIAPMSLSDARTGYFNLRDRKSSNSSEANELGRSESESFTSAMSKLNLDESRYDSDDSASTASGHSGLQNRTALEGSNRPSTTSSLQTQMPPPAMKLFDPKDGHKKFVGTPDYLAPETINGSGQDDMVDWWSLGVIMFEFLYGYPPFHASTPEAVFQNILNRRIDWPSVSEEIDLEISDAAKVMMESLMVLHPAERLGSQNGASDIKCQKFFQAVAWEKISEEEALFIPTPDHPEDTDYFDARGATNHVFEDESDTQLSSDGSPVTNDKGKSGQNQDSAFSKRLANSNRQMLKRSVMPLSIPPHVRDRKHRSRRLSESGSEDFGSFTFKNLNVLEKQNQEALKRLRTEHSSSSPIGIPKDVAMMHHQRSASSSGASQARRSLSVASSLSSTPISPVGQPPSNSRLTMPSSPLTPAQTFSKTLPKSTPRGSFSFALGAQTLDHNQTSLASSPNDTNHRTRLPSNSLPMNGSIAVNPRSRAFTVGADTRPEMPFDWSSVKRIPKVFDPETPSSSSDTESSSGVKALQRVQRRRSKRLSSISLSNSAELVRSYRPLDILICEDNPVSRRVLEAMLSKLKCRVVSVVDGAQAVAAATADVIFDIIFTDIKIPRLSGVEVARLVKSSFGSNSNTPIVAMSSYSTADFKEIAQYFERRLEKPLTIATISSTIQELIPNWCEHSTRPGKTSNDDAHQV